MGISVAVALLLSAAFSTAVRVPGRVEVVADLWPLLPVIPAGVLLNACYYLGDDLERISVRSMAERKVGHVALSVVAIATLIALSPPGVNPSVACRNSCFLVGQGYALSGLVPRTWAMLIQVLTPAVMWLIGTQSPGIPPSSWAFLVHDSGSTAAAVAALTLLVCGLGVFLVKGPGSMAPRGQ
ncbi:MAG: hypothetical protein QY307_02440 [Acidimicrobiia bacterium]|nr:MAG: hypothetical protein QY307_02440 [Acidimicrobiia bacterium]